MGSRKVLSFTFITLIVGFMLAIQFQTVQNPVVRDTRDTWELRDDLNKGKELQAKLISEIRSNEEKIAQYETEREQSKEETLRTTLAELKEEAGLTEITGTGVRIYIDKVNEELVGHPIEAQLSPDSLRRLLNELNTYGAKHVSIAGQRVINTTVIREIAGEVKINGRSLKTLPIEILVITEDYKTAEKLSNRLKASHIGDEFFIDNLNLSITDTESEITIPAYDDSITIRNIKVTE